jgi:FkbM family methyltransferase
MKRRALASLLRSKEFRRSLPRRLAWRLHWRLHPSKPLIVPGYKGVELALARSSASSGIYINRGGSNAIVANLFTEFLTRGMVAIDCGAHIGEYTVMFAALVGDRGSVHAFEPDARIFPYLTKNVKDNGFRNVVLNNSALSDRLGFAEFELAEDPTASSLRSVSARRSDPLTTERVQLMTLDAYTAREGIDRIDAVKIDVEGAEASVIAGARQLFAAATPPKLVFIECEGSQGPADLVRRLTGFGYEVSIPVQDTQFPYVVARFRE